MIARQPSRVRAWFDRLPMVGAGYRGHSWACRWRTWRMIRLDRRARDAWVRDWPDYCDSCNGWGGSASWGDYWTPPDFDPCDATPDLETCHRCGGRGLDDDGAGPCSICGWDYDDGIAEPCGDPAEYCDCINEEW